jgi:hypothetical protein
MEAQEEDVSQATQPPSSTSSASVLFGQRMPFNIERQTSMNRQLAPFILGVGFCMPRKKREGYICLVLFAELTSFKLVINDQKHSFGPRSYRKRQDNSKYIPSIGNKS